MLLDSSSAAVAIAGAAVGAAGALLLCSRPAVPGVRPERFKHAPKRLILVRHGESQGNVDDDIYEHTADNALHLTKKGWGQAESAGRALREIVGDESVHFYVSPYVRTRETFHAIAKAFGGYTNVPWREDPRIREQDWGNFQDVEKVARQNKERKKFGKFFYRFPDGGESSCDVYDRVSTFLETLYRQWCATPASRPSGGGSKTLLPLPRSEHPGEVENQVIVAHGLTMSVFMMRWFKYSVDDFHAYDNPTNCEIFVMEKDGERGKLAFKYIVRNKDGTPDWGTPERQEQRRRKPTEGVHLREMAVEQAWPDEPQKAEAAGAQDALGAMREQIQQLSKREAYLQKVRSRRPSPRICIPGI